MKYRRALVTGGAGFIGSHLVERLVNLGVETVVYDNLSVGKASNVPHGVILVKGDILDEKTLQKAMKDVDIVFHNAAKCSIRDSFDNFYDDVNINVLGTINVLKSIIKSETKKIIFASSMAVYPNDSAQVPSKEDVKLEPPSPYGISKLAGEKYCIETAKTYGFDAVCLRYFNTYGTRQTFTPYVGVITIFINRLLEGKPPIILGDGKQIRDFIYVGDIVEANLLAMKKNVTVEVFNVGTGIGTSVNQVARLVIDKINPNIKPKHAPAKYNEHKYSVADISKAKRLLGFEAEHRLEYKIDEIIEFIRNNKI